MIWDKVVYFISCHCTKKKLVRVFSARLKFSRALINSINNKTTHLVHSLTFSSSPFIPKYLSQLSQPSSSNWSTLFIIEHSKQARKLRKSRGILSTDILKNIYVKYSTFQKTTQPFHHIHLIK